MLIYEDDNLLNPYDNREEFVKEYERLNKKINQIKSYIQKTEETEIVNLHQ